MNDYFYRMPEGATSKQLTDVSDVSYTSGLFDVVTEQPEHVALPSRLSVIWLFQSYLDERRFGDALTLYQEHENYGSVQGTILRASLVKQVSLWRQQGDLDVCINALECFTQYYYQDAELLKMQVSILEENKELARAIELCIQVSPLASKKIEKAYYMDKIHQIARSWFNEQQQSGSTATCLSLFQKLVYLEPDYSFYRFALALMYLSLGGTNDAIKELEFLLLDQEFGQKSSVLLTELQPVLPEKPEPQPAGMIPLQANGRHLLVQVRAGEKDQVRLLIDTGASLTTMPSRLLQELKRKKLAARVGHVELKTANGARFAALYSLKSFQIGQYLLKNLEVAELDMGEEERADGLLGMNVLSRFRFQIDQERPALILSPR